MQVSRASQTDVCLSVCPTSQAGILSLFFSFTITTIDMRYAGDTCRVQLAFNTNGRGTNSIASPRYNNTKVASLSLQ